MIFKPIERSQSESLQHCQQSTFLSQAHMCARPSRRLSIDLNPGPCLALKFVPNRKWDKIRIFKAQNDRELCQIENGRKFASSNTKRSGIAPNGKWDKICIFKAQNDPSLCQIENGIKFASSNTKKSGIVPNGKWDKIRIFKAQNDPNLCQIENGIKFASSNTK